MAEQETRQFKSELTRNRILGGLDERDERLVDLMVDSLPGIFYLISDQGRFLRWNKRFEEVSRYSADEISKMSPLDFFGEDDKLMIAERIHDVFTRGEATAEADFVAKGGDKSPYFFTGKRIEIDGTPFLVGMGVDATERRQAMIAQVYLAAIVESSDDAIISKTLDGTITSWNKSAERIFGYTAEEAIGKSIRLIIPPELADEENEILGKLRRGERIKHFETERVRKDGSRIQISVSISPIRNNRGEVVGASKIARNITERKRIEQSLAEEVREQEALYRLVDQLHHAEQLTEVYDSALDAILSALQCNRASILLFDNSGVMRFVASRGLSSDYRKATEGHSPWNADEKNPKPICVNDVDCAEIGDSLIAIIKGEGIGSLAFIPLVTNGKLIGKFMTYFDAPHIFREDEIKLSLSIARQLAFGIDRKRAEQELRENDRRKDEFLAMLAHELRNPLTPIRNAIQVLNRISSLEPEPQRLRDMIDRQVTHLTRLVDDLLDVSRITRNKISLRKENLELMTIIGRAVETSRPLIDERKHHLSVSLPPDSVQVEGDLTRLAQVVSNLLNNAAKYTEEGGYISLVIEHSGSEVVIRVKDNGVGIPAHVLPHIFDLFTQAERSLDRSQGGLGIGLTLVRRLVELHGGRVEAHSAGPGKGSEFIVRLPAIMGAKSKSERTVPATTSGAPPTWSCRILVVDDNADAADSMAMLLKLGGHDVRVAYDGLAAVEAARGFRPQAMLLDIGLPGMDGYEVARRLRRLDETKDAFLIALTGYGKKEDRIKALASGFNYHITKPVDAEEMDAIIKSLDPNRLNELAEYGSEDEVQENPMLDLESESG